MLDIVFIEKNILFKLIEKIALLSNTIDENVKFIIIDENLFYSDYLALKTKIHNICKHFSLEECCFPDISTIENNVKMTLDNERNIKTYAIIVDEASSYLKKMYPNNIVECKNVMIDEKIINNIAWVLSNFGKDRKIALNTWFWSDPHFFHKNIIKYCNRPWNSGTNSSGDIIVTDDDVKRMNDALIEKFNSVVGKNDIVWCLGDFSFGSKDHISEIMSRLNGNIKLIKGNHDKYDNKVYLDAGFNWVYDKPVIINSFVILSHEPMMCLNDNSPFYNIYGHIHDSTMFQTYAKHSCCVCVERHNYMPVSWKTINKML